MFYLVDKKENLIREHEDRRALRKIKRKQTNSDQLLILEGESFKKALAASKKAEAKSEKESKAKASKIESKTAVSKKRKLKVSKTKTSKELPEKLHSK